jgi:hypothetical protein
VQFCVERCVKADLFLSLKPFSEIFYCVSVRGFIHLKSATEHSNIKNERKKKAFSLTIKKTNAKKAFLA